MSEERKRVPRWETKLTKVGELSVKHEELSCFDYAAEVLHEYLEGKDRENLVVILMGPGNRIVGIETVAIGTSMETKFSMAALLRPAILSGATKMIVGHNHPLGDATEPTEMDMIFTRRMLETSALMGIELVDNIVVDSTGRALSLNQALLIEEEYLSQLSADEAACAEE